MTQDELAKAMGYKDRSMITKIESGKVDISQKKVESFAKVLHTTPAFLMGWTEDPSESEPQRVIPIVVPDSARFVKLVHFMPEDDYQMVMHAFERAEERMREAEGVIE